MLFHTEATMEMVALKTKMRNHGWLTSQQLTVSPGLVSERSKIIPSGFLNDDSFLFLSSDSSSTRSEVQDCVLVDALTVAISRVRISKPKRSRLCGPTGPVQQECSSNIKVNNLCTAF